MLDPAVEAARLLKKLTDKKLRAMLSESPSLDAVRFALRVQTRDGGRGGSVARKSKRKLRDLYETPPETCAAIVARLARLLPSPVESLGTHTHDDGSVRESLTTRAWRIVEPSAGSGNFVRALRDNLTFRDAKIIAVDLQPENALPLHRAGATSYVTGCWQEQDLAAFDADLHVGNRPFSEAEEHIHRSLSMLREGAFCADLVPWSFHGTQGRCGGFWREFPARYVMALAERPGFTLDGKTDMAEYTLTVWQKGFSGHAEILPAIWRAEGAVATPAVAAPAIPHGA